MSAHTSFSAPGADASWDGNGRKTALRAGGIGLVLLLAAGAAVLTALALEDSLLLRLTLPESPLMLAGVLVVSVGILALLRHPALTLWALAGVVYLNLSQVLVRGWELPSLLQLLFLPAALCAWADQTSRPRSLPSPRILGALALYLAVVLASTVAALDPGAAGRRFGVVAKAFLLVLLVALLARGIRRLSGVAWVLSGGAALLGLLALCQAVAGDDLGELGGMARVKYAQLYGSQFGDRAAGPLGDPNFFAQSLVLAVPFGLGLVVQERGRRRWLAGGFSLLALVGIGLTWSRGGLLALAAVGGLWLLSEGVRGRVLAPLAVAGLLAGSLAWSLAPAGLAQGLGERLSALEQVLPGGAAAEDLDSSLQKRRLYMLAAWRMFLDRPLLGVGAGNYSVHYDEVVEDIGLVPRLYLSPEDLRYPHNLYLEIAAETGLAGLAAFGLVLLAVFTGLRRVHGGLFAGRPGRRARLARAVTLALIGYLLSSLFLHGHFLRYLWLLFALAAALEVVSSAEEAEEPEEAEEKEAA